MKILFFQWHSFLNKGMERALKKLDIGYDTFFYQFTDWEKDDVFLERLKKKIKGTDYRLVLSVNFSPLISEVCEEFGLPYISWVYDSPVHIKDLESMKRSCNHIYFFDQKSTAVPAYRQSICPLLWTWKFLGRRLQARAQENTVQRFPWLENYIRQIILILRRRCPNI